MSPKQGNLLATLKTKIDKLAIGGLGVLLLVIVAIYYIDRNKPPPPEPPAPKNLNLGDKIAESQDYQLLMIRTNSDLTFEESDYYAIGTFNMFDIQTVRDKETIDQEADAKYREAKSLQDQGDMEGALEKCNEVLQIRPSHIPAREMKAKIEKLNAEKKEDGQVKAS